MIDEVRALVADGTPRSRAGARRIAAPRSRDERARRCGGRHRRPPNAATSRSRGPICAQLPPAPWARLAPAEYVRSGLALGARRDAAGRAGAGRRRPTGRAVGELVRVLAASSATGPRSSPARSSPSSTGTSAGRAGLAGGADAPRLDAVVGRGRRRLTHRSRPAGRAPRARDHGLRPSGRRPRVGQHRRPRPEHRRARAPRPPPRRAPARRPRARRPAHALRERTRPELRAPTISTPTSR